MQHYKIDKSGNLATNNESGFDSEILLLLETLYEKYGFDFRGYSEAHIRRRIKNRIQISGIKNIYQLIDLVVKDKNIANQLLQDLSITVTEMFRDSNFYLSLREKIIPILQTYPFIKIWHAGCATGEEVYSMAILLTEAGLYDRAIIYATDFNQKALDHAKAGIFPLKKMQDYELSYQLSGGKNNFERYFTSKYDYAILNQSLKKNIVWANHNLVTDSEFAEVHLIFCRNVLIYFEKALQNKVHHLFYNSLVKGGFLCLGTKESLRFSSITEKYTEFDKQQRIFKKNYNEF